MITKLRVRFVLVNMGIVSVLLTAMMFVVFRFNQYSIQTQSVSAMQRQLAISMNPHAPGKDVPEEPLIACFNLELTAGGELRAWGSDIYDLSDEAYLRALLQQASLTGERQGILEEYNLRFVHSAQPWGDRYLFADISTEQQILRNIRNSCLMTGVISFGAFFFVSVILAVWITRPVKKAWQQQRQFVADASHELKTPLSVIMANAELLQDDTADGETRKRFSGHILSMSYQMRTLVERMLEMARVDNLKVTRVPLDLSQLTQDAVLSVQLLYEEKQRPLVSDIQEDVFVRGSESHLYQLLDVLLDNALKYSQGEAAVAVTLKSYGRRCVLSVSSPGQELTKQQRKDIFKRFYRIDQARSLDGSYGLGLSIAQGIVKLHKGRIRVVSSQNTNTFHVLLPACNPPR